MPGRCRALALAAGVLAATAGQAQVLNFADLDGWQDDDHQAALDAFLVACDLIGGKEWAPLCALAPEAATSTAVARSLTTIRSVAVDPGFTPQGVPVWIDKKGAAPLRGLMNAQDTGGAITGAQRADIFFGTGFAAGEAAGQVKDGGRMVMLLPIERAFALSAEG